MKYSYRKSITESYRDDPSKRRKIKPTHPWKNEKIVSRPREIIDYLESRYAGKQINLKIKKGL